MKKIKLIAAVFGFSLLFGFALSPVGTVAALDTSNPLGEVCQGDSTAACSESSTGDAAGITKRIINILLFVIGALAAVMLIFGGILYATSSGDSGRVSKAKNTILYSIVGLVLAVLAFAIVNWVVDLFI